MIGEKWNCFNCNKDNEIRLIGENSCDCGHGVVLHHDGCLTRTSAVGGRMPEDCTKCKHLNEKRGCWEKKRKIQYPRYSICNEYKQKGFL